MGCIITIKCVIMPQGKSRVTLQPRLGHIFYVFVEII
jgi:hypothetical protein